MKKLNFKNTLVLDMDETLLKASSKPISKKIQPHRVIDLAFKGIQGLRMYIYFRPYLTHFLKTLSQHFELIVYTSGEDNYANKILDQLEDKRRYFACRLTKQNCTDIKGFQSKDLRILQGNRKI